MAKQSPKSSLSDEMTELVDLRTQSFNSLVQVRNTWTDKESLLIAQNADSFSKNSTRSRVTDAHISTLVFERAARVAAQLPSGKVYALNNKEDGADDLMNIVLQKYIVPNANSGGDLLTKLRMSGIYASVYGIQPILYDYRIDDEYIGPDAYLIPVRHFYPQPGKNSMQDSDWAMVSTIVSVRWLEQRIKNSKTWNKQNVQDLIDKAKQGSAPSYNRDGNKRSVIEISRETGTPMVGKGKAARIELITKYERGRDGRWLTYAVDYPDCGILRDIPNPHKSGKIPIVVRQCFPLVDSIWGLGDFERGMSLQKAKDSLINLYLDAVKLSIFPPIKMDLSAVTPSTIRQEAGARWLMKDLNAIQPYETNPQGLQTFQSTYQFLTGGLLNQFGTTDTNATARSSGDTAFGKTPEALQMLQSRESARDNWDRFMLEKCVEELYDGMINLLGENQEKPINFHLFDDDIEDIMQSFDIDTVDKFMKPINSKVAKVSIPKSIIGGKYKFQVDANSSTTDDQKGQVQALQTIMTMYMQGKQVIDQSMQVEGMEFNLAQAFKQFVINSGVNDWDSIVEELNDDEKGKNQLIQQMPQFSHPDVQQAAMQMFGGQQGMQQNMSPQSLQQIQQMATQGQDQESPQEQLTENGEQNGQ